MRNRKRSRKRELSFRIKAAHRKQPGYQDIWKEKNELEIAGREILSGIYREKYERIRAIEKRFIITRALGVIYYKTYHPYQSENYHFYLLLYVILVAVPLYHIVGHILFITISSALFLPLSLRFIVNPISAFLLRCFLHKHQAELRVFDARASAKEVEIKGAIASWFEQRCEKFSGYPPDWQQRREAALVRDRYACQHCQKGVQLEVHHLLPLSMGGTNHIDNLQTLCNQCHRREHAN